MQISIRYLPVRPGGLRLLMVGSDRGGLAKTFYSPNHVGNLQVGVGVHRQVDGRMAGELLGHLGMDAGRGQGTGELVSQGVEVEHLAGVIPVAEEVRSFAPRALR